MEAVIGEIVRVLKPERYMALYVCDSFVKDRPLLPIGFRLFSLLAKHLVPVDIIAVTRHNATLKRGHWHSSAVEGNYLLRGFNYLLVMYKEGKRHPNDPKGFLERRDPAEVAAHLEGYGPRVADDTEAAR
jgi:adenine-specific DNA-methyltransferase